MGPIAIRAEHLSKQYRIGARQAMYRTIRETLTDTALSPLRRLRGAPSNFQDTIWALDDVSFEIGRGDAVGIIGRNGAGKSTLLKVLSRITWPTRGRVELFGRVGSLLEVGTGFHHELTGRENIYLNGAILGMNRREIERKFDEIVAFSEVEKFLDTPVKYYSSGMYVRLAFAVAAHLEPEILVVDEVLAVGDAQFQKKCLGKMGEVEKEGRTILFVSHNMAAVLSLCSQCILLKEGKVEIIGPARMVAEHYMASGIALNGEVQFADSPSSTEKPFRFQKVTLRTPTGEVSSQVDLLEGVTVQLTYRIIRPLRRVKTSFRLRNAAGVIVLGTGDIDEDPLPRLNAERIPGMYVARCHIPRKFLRPGRYSIDIWAGYPGIRTLDEYFQAIAFDVVDTGSVEALIGEGNSESILSPVLPWETVILDKPMPQEIP
jgi:lipopolysaccharide transport system ATP-binding protein